MKKNLGSLAKAVPNFQPANWLNSQSNFIL